jgi:hypothetical protein
MANNPAITQTARFVKQQVENDRSDRLYKENGKMIARPVYESVTCGISTFVL